MGRDLEESYGGIFPHYVVESELKGDMSLARELDQAMSSSRDNSTRIRGWNDVIPLPLHWGETLPFGFFQNKHPSKGAQQSPEAVILGLPLSRSLAYTSTWQSLAYMYLQSWNLL